MGSENFKGIILSEQARFAWLDQNFFLLYDWKNLLIQLNSSLD